MSAEITSTSTQVTPTAQEKMAALEASIASLLQEQLERGNNVKLNNLYIKIAYISSAFSDALKNFDINLISAILEKYGNEEEFIKKLSNAIYVNVTVGCCDDSIHPFSYALRHERLDVVKILLRYGVLPTEKCYEMVLEGNYEDVNEIFSLLWTNEPNKNERLSDKSGIVGIACRALKIEIVELLLNNNARPKYSGYLPLLTVVISSLQNKLMDTERFGSRMQHLLVALKLVWLLLLRGVDLPSKALQEYQGFSPLRVCMGLCDNAEQKNKLTEIISLMKSYGGKALDNKTIFSPASLQDLSARSVHILLNERRMPLEQLSSLELSSAEKETNPTRREPGKYYGFFARRDAALGTSSPVIESVSQSKALQPA